MRPDNILTREHCSQQRESRTASRQTVRSVAAKRHCTPLQLGVSVQGAMCWHAVGQQKHAGPGCSWWYACTNLGAVVFWKESERKSDLEKLVGFRHSSGP